MIQLNLSIWQLIEGTQAAPFTLAGIEKILGQTLVEQTQKLNDYVQFFAGQQLALAGNSTIVKIDLRLPRDTSNSKGMPRGGSLEEATTFSASNAWGEVSFGFQQKKPNCLGYLVFKPGT